jgi:hypothetical protein
MDMIPLTEIKMIREMDVDEDSKSKDPNAFMIETSPEGYNSGRTYYIQAESSSSCRAISSKFSQSSAIAQERANARTAFEQAQRRVGKVYSANWFQNSVALLIIAVPPPPPSSPLRFLLPRLALPCGSSSRAPAYFVHRYTHAQCTYVLTHTPKHALTVGTRTLRRARARALASARTSTRTHPLAGLHSHSNLHARPRADGPGAAERCGVGAWRAVPPRPGWEDAIT